MEFLYIGIIIFLCFLAISDIIVGVSNDAVNFLNSAVGSRTARYKTLIIIASIGVFAGAALSNGMMDVARHGIFQPQYFSFSELLCIFLAVMVTDVILLDAFNSKGLPTSTTVSLVFELLGGTVALAIIKSFQTDGALTFAEMINADKALSVVLGIFLSIIIAFFFGIAIQWITRILFTFRYKKKMKYFGGIFGGIAVTAILYFLVIKGLKDAAFMTPENKSWINENTGRIVLYFFLGSSVIMQVLQWCKVNILRVIVLLGTLSLAMAFAGNDLVNFVGVPFTGLAAYQDYAANGTGIGADNYMMESLLGPAQTPVLLLVASGVIMVLALATSRKARNVINTEVSLTNQNDGENSFGSSAAGRRLVQIGNSLGVALDRVTPLKVKNWIDARFDKKDADIVEGAAFDQLRASVNLVVSALLIALGTSLKLPLSTTFVTFTVAMGTSLMDRAWNRETAVSRVTGMMSVMGGWLLTAVIAFAVCFFVALLMRFGGSVVMILFSIVAIVIVIRSNIRFSRKAEENKAENDRFTRIFASSDKEEVWALMKENLKENTLHVMNYTSDYYGRFVDCFMSENLRCLRKLYSSLRDEMQDFKAVRRKEILAMKRTDPVISLQAGTWFHLSSNNLSQLLYGLKRITEPCSEHLENNYNPLTAECREEFAPVAEAFLVLIARASDYISNFDPEKSPNPANIIKEISAFKKTVSTIRQDNVSRFQAEEDTSNLNIYILYQSILQETQQMADSMKHMLRAYAYLLSVKQQ